MRLRVRSKLVLYISIPLVITYSAMLGWDYVQQRQDARDLSESLVLGRAELSAAILDARLEQAQQIALSLAESFAQRQEHPDLRARWTPRAAVSQFDWAVGLVVAFEDPTRPGMVVHRLREPGGADLLPPGLDHNSPQSPWYWNIKQNPRRGAWFAPSDVAGIFSRPTIAFSAPILVEGEFRGVVSLHVSPDVFQFAPVSRPIGSGRAAAGPSTAPSGEASAFDLQMDSYLIASGPGEVVFHSPDRLPAPADMGEAAVRPVGMLLDDAWASARLGTPELVAIRDVPVTMFDLQRGRNYWVSLAPIRGGQWVMLSTYAEARYMDPINASMIRRSVFLFGGMCFMLAIVAFASRRISRPLEELEHSTQALGAGNLDVAVPEPRGRDEVAELSRMFNAMLQRLRAQVQQIREESEARARVEGELELARQIQTSLLPREVPHGSEDAKFEIHACNLPASHVAGDFYDFFVDSTGRLMLVIADVAGHGMPAALLMAVTRTLIRNLAASGLPPAEIAIHTNRSLLDNGTEGMFVTLVLCIYDPRTGELTYTNAGHPKPLVLRSAGMVEPACDSTAPLLGAYAFCEDLCTQRTIHLQPGDTLVLYTDGVVEARPTPETDEFGMQRFRASLAAEAGQPLAKVCQGVVNAVQGYQQGPLLDDVTLLLLRRL